MNKSTVFLHFARYMPRSYHDTGHCGAQILSSKSLCCT